MSPVPRRIMAWSGVGLTLIGGGVIVAIAEAPEKLAPETLLVRHATVWTQGAAGVLEDHDLLVRDGKVAAIGSDLRTPAGAVEIDASGKHVTPGLVDCHSHTAIRGGANEGSNNITAEVRIADVLDPDDINIYRQLAGGLTTAHILHGSANSIGGQDAVVKLRRDATSSAELLIPDAWPGIKFALGENPKRSNLRTPSPEPRYPATRMGVMASIRERFLAAQEYMQAWERYDALSAARQAHTAPPRRDLQLDAIAEILRGERRVHSHSYRQDEILALMRLCEDFDVTIATFQHVLEGYKVADEIARHGAGGSTFSDWWAYKIEAYDAIPYNGALMHECGVTVSFNSDSAELARRMNLEAAKAIKWGGVEPTEALAFVTLNAARQLGIDDRVGSLERGKDADFVIWSGDPLSVYSIVEQTWVDGVREFDRGVDLAGREAVEQERAELLARVRGDDGEHDESPPAVEASVPQPRPQPSPPDFVDRLAATAPTVSIVHATVHTASDGVIEDGTVSFRRGRIVEVGAALDPLGGAEVIDATGKHLWPGMIDLNTAIGLTEISSVAGSVDVAEAGEINPDANTAIAINPDSELIPVTRANGVTHVLSVPSGGLISGTSAFVRLEGWTWEDLTAVELAAMHVRWPSWEPPRRRAAREQSEEERKKAREEQIERIRRTFDDARAYARAREAEEQGGERVDIDPRLEAMLPVVHGLLPVVLHAGEIRQIRSAMAWADQERLPYVLAGSGDLWRVADELAAREVPVILTSILALPRREDEPYDVRFTEALKLREAGVSFCFATGGSTFAAAMVRGLPYQAAMSAAFGLPREEAWRAVTLYPARILGLEEHLGSIEEGKSASLILTDGDPLEIRTRIEQVFIDGRPVDPDDNKHHRMWERYGQRLP